MAPSSLVAIASFCIAACLVPAAQASATVTQTGAKVTPIEKVIELLGKVDKDLEAEGKEEAAAYDKYACFAKDQVTTKKLDIEKANEKIADLTADIDALGEEIVQLNGEKAGLQQDITSATEAKKQAADERRAAKTAFLDEEQDLKKAVQNIEGALRVLAESKSQMFGANLGLVAASKTVDLGALADKLLLHKDKLHMSPEAMTFLQAASKQAPVDRYSYHSNEVIDLLGKLKVETIQNLADRRMREFKDQSNWEKADAAAAREIKYMKRMVGEKEEIIAEKEGIKVDKEADRAATIKDRDIDEAFLEQVVADAQQKAASWDARSTGRQEERAAIASCLEKLKEKVAPNAKAIKKIYFLQLGSSRRFHQPEDEDTEADEEFDHDVDVIQADADIRNAEQKEEAAVEDAEVRADSELMEDEVNADAQRVKEEVDDSDDMAKQDEQEASEIAAESKEEESEAPLKAESEATEDEPEAESEADAEPEAQEEMPAETFLQVVRLRGRSMQASSTSARVRQEAATERARIFLVKASEALKSSNLLAMSARVAAAPDFENVREMLHDLIARLEAERDSELTVKQHCDQIKDIVDESPIHIEKLNADKFIDTKKKEKLEGEIKELSAEIAKATKEKNEAAQLRQENNKANLDTQDLCTEGSAGIDEAIAILNNYYGSSFLQVDSKEKGTSGLEAKAAKASEKQPGGKLADDPFKGETDYTGNTDHSTGIYGLLEVIKADFERQKQKSADEEAAQVAAYQAFVQEIDSLIQHKEALLAPKPGMVIDLESDLAGYETDLKQWQEIHLTKVAEFKALRADCVKPTDHAGDYEKRVAAREKEVKALQDAYEVLMNWNK